MYRWETTLGLMKSSPASRVFYYGVRVSSSLISFDTEPSTLGFTALRIPFTRIHVTGLCPLGATPTHSSPFIVFSGSLLWGNPASWLPQTRLSWVFTIHPHLEAAPQ